MITDPCKECQGRGRIPETRKVEVKIPPGVDSGVRMRLEGRGEAGVRGGPPGDLYVDITVKPHPVFTRRGNDLLCEQPISIYHAVLGGEIEVPTIDGKNASLGIAEGTTKGTSFGLKGKGMPDIRGRGRGDQHVKVKVIVPTRLSEKEKELFRELAELRGDLPGDKPGSKNIFEKIKDAWERRA